MTQQLGPCARRTRMTRRSRHGNVTQHPLIPPHSLPTSCQILWKEKRYISSLKGRTDRQKLPNVNLLKAEREQHRRDFPSCWKDGLTWRERPPSEKEDVTSLHKPARCIFFPWRMIDSTTFLLSLLQNATRHGSVKSHRWGTRWIVGCSEVQYQPGLTSTPAWGKSYPQKRSWKEAGSGGLCPILWTSVPLPRSVRTRSQRPQHRVLSLSPISNRSAAHLRPSCFQGHLFTTHLFAAGTIPTDNRQNSIHKFVFPCRCLLGCRMNSQPRVCSSASKIWLLWHRRPLTNSKWRICSDPVRGQPECLLHAKNSPCEASKNSFLAFSKTRKVGDLPKHLNAEIMRTPAIMPLSLLLLFVCACVRA